jgi:prevent-host-death family protein
MQILPKVLPINELKNTANISKMCKDSNVPIIITKNGYSDMVLMSVDLYEQTMAKLQAAVLLNEAINDPNRKKEKIELDVFIEQLKNEKKI